jgi:hypothetical protein
MPQALSTLRARCRAAGQAVLLSGEAVALLPNDPRSPLLYRDRWYTAGDGTQDELWHPVDDQQQAQLDAMLPGSPSSVTREVNRHDQWGVRREGAHRLALARLDPARRPAVA